MKFLPASIPGVVIVEPDVYPDRRGFFFETYHAEKYRAGGIVDAFVQDNQSKSTAGTLRGLHLQLRLGSQRMRAPGYLRRVPWWLAGPGRRCRRRG